MSCWQILLHSIIFSIFFQVDKSCNLSICSLFTSFTYLNSYIINSYCPVICIQLDSIRLFEWPFRFLSGFFDIYVLPLNKNGLMMFWYLCHTWITDSFSELTLWWCSFYGQWLTHPYLCLFGHWLIHCPYIFSFSSE